MKETQIVYNVQTGQQEVIEVELTQAELDEREKQNKVSQINQRMSEIKQELNASDWKSIKRLEGSLSDEDWQVHIDTRAKLREEYNLLELELG